MVLLEAMECGLPCISFDLPGPNEIIRSGEDGYIVQNSKEFIYKLKYLMNNDTLRKEYGYKAKNNIQRYSIETIGEIWNELFNKI